MPSAKRLARSFQVLPGARAQENLIFGHEVETTGLSKFILDLM